jgi:hypothetical protein
VGGGGELDAIFLARDDEIFSCGADFALRIPALADAIDPRGISAEKNPLCDVSGDAACDGLGIAQDGSLSVSLAVSLGIRGSLLTPSDTPTHEGGKRFS